MGVWAGPGQARKWDGHRAGREHGLGAGWRTPAEGPSASGCAQGTGPVLPPGLLLAVTGHTVAAQSLWPPKAGDTQEGCPPHLQRSGGCQEKLTPGPSPLTTPH